MLTPSDFYNSLGLFFCNLILELFLTSEIRSVLSKPITPNLSNPHFIHSGLIITVSEHNKPFPPSVFLLCFLGVFIFSFLSLYLNILPLKFFHGKPGPHHPAIIKLQQHATPLITLSKLCPLQPN